MFVAHKHAEVPLLTRLFECNAVIIFKESTSIFKKRTFSRLFFPSKYDVPPKGVFVKELIPQSYQETSVY